MRVWKDEVWGMRVVQCGCGGVSVEDECIWKGEGVER